MRVDVRAATADDLDALATLRPHVHDKHVAARPDYFKPVMHAAARAEAATWLEQENARVLLAVADGEPVGYLLAYVVTRAEGGLVHARRFVLVDQIAVTESARGRGYGKALLDGARALARRLSIDTVELEVWAFNVEAREFFLAQGFAPMRQRLSRAAGGP
jgi:diamine N-acetyltransferase